MRKIIKTLLVVLVLCLVLTVFASCDKIFTKPTEKPEPGHTHTFGDASCTEPAKCECGVTQGEALGHDYLEGVCSRCGSYDPDYLPPHDHNYVDGKCDICGEYDPDYVPPHKHNFVDGKCECGEEDPNYVPPHEHNFVDGKCECGEEDPNYVPPHEHSWSDATCTEPQKCECGETQGEALGHKEVVDAAVDATCAATGLTEGKHCEVCGEVIVAQQEVEKVAHTMVYVTTHPTEESKGSTVATCSVCGEVVNYGEVGTMGVGTYLLNASDLDGIAQYTLIDGEVKVVAGVFDCHLSNKYRTDAGQKKTFPDDYYGEYRMNFGGKTEFGTEENPGRIKNGIVFTTTGETTVTVWWVEGGDDYRQVGLYNLAGEIVVKSDNQTAAKNDPCIDTFTVPAGTYVLGNVINTNYIFKVEVVVAEAHTHELVDVEGKAATCTEDGYTAHKACECGYTEGKEVVPAGHTLVDVEAKAATCTEDGYTAHKACECGYTEGKEVVPALGHSYTDGYCTNGNCGAVDPDYYFTVTIPEALAAKDGSKVLVSGTVSAINTAWSDSYGNITVTIVDAEGNELYIYRMKTNVALGDIITVKGEMATYNGRQIGAGSTAEITGHDSSYDYEEMSIVDAIAADDNTNVIVTGTVVKINTAYSSSYNNISVTIADDNGTQLYLYRLAGGSDLAVGDIITVKGSMATYNGSRQVTGGTFEAVGTHTCSNYNDATCKVPATCVVCGTAKDDVLSTEHNYVDGVCSVCNGLDPNYEGEVIELATESLSVIANTGVYDSTAKNITWTATNFTFVNAQASSTSAIRTSDSDHFRAYAKSETTISGSKITKIVITCTSASYATACGNSISIEGITVTVEGSVVTLTVDSGSVDSISFVASAQWRLKSVEVTYQK